MQSVYQGINKSAPSRLSKRVCFENGHSLNLLLLFHSALVLEEKYVFYFKNTEIYLCIGHGVKRFILRIFMMTALFQFMLMYVI